MNLFSLFGHMPLAVVAGILAANVIPYLSALATKAPTWATGALTLLLAGLDGFFAAWAAQGDQFDWRGAAGTALAAWVVAIMQHRAVLSGTATESRLHSVGASPPATG